MIGHNQLCYNRGHNAILLDCRIKILRASDYSNTSNLLNQARAGRRLVRAWFLRIDPVQIVGMRVRVRVCVCVSMPEAIYN